jgi:DNA-binding response OmpR family regulator
LLIVEDEVRLAAALQRGLATEGFAVDIAHDGITGLDLATGGGYDAVVLDVMLPGLSGYRVCQELRAAGNWVPVLMLSAKDGEYDQADGLDVGADDYLTKPFSLRELAARVHALLRREERSAQLAAEATPAGAAIVVGDLEINPAERRVRRAGVEVHLTPIEFDLLSHLARRPRTVLPRQRLLAQVWGWSESTAPRGNRYASAAASGTRTVDSHVKALRRKLGADVIRTVHGVGYSLEIGAVPDLGVAR